MPYRKCPIAANNFYHIYNRGNNHGEIFFEDKNYYFLIKKIFNEFNHVAEIVAYCLMPNHYHLIVKVTDDEKFSKTMNKIFISYTKSINKAYNRSGHLFEGRYKSKLVPENNYLLHLSRYIHLNPVRANLVSHPAKWKYSSYNAYIGKSSSYNLENGIILEQIKDYAEFVNSYQEDQYYYIKDFI